MSWNTCKFPECENWTYRPDVDYCETHRRANEKQKENDIKAAEKRKALLSKPKKVYSQPNKISDKRKIENEEYKRLRDEFLFENPDCQIKANAYCSKVATTIHHTAGRVGDNFLDVTKWKGACMSCHQFLHDHPKEAIEKGWSESRLAKTEPHKI